MLERMSREANVLLASLPDGSPEQKGAAKHLALFLWYLGELAIHGRTTETVRDTVARAWTAVVAFLPEYVRAETPREQNDVLQRMSRVVSDRKP